MAEAKLVCRLSQKRVAAGLKANGVAAARQHPTRDIAAAINRPCGALSPQMFVKVWIDQQASRIQGQELAGNSRWYDIPVSEIPSAVRKALMPHYRYSTGMFFYEEYRFSLQIASPVTDDKVIAALEECAMHVGEIVSAYQSYSKFKRALLLFRSIICGYIDVVSNGRPTKQSVACIDMVSNEAHCPQ